jgi:hypothetical protein
MNEMKPAPQLNWAGGIIRPGEGYGGKAEQIPPGCPAVLGKPVRKRPMRDRLGMSPEERAFRQSEMMKQRWAQKRSEMLRNVIERARQANLKIGQRKRRLSVGR